MRRKVFLCMLGCLLALSLLVGCGGGAGAKGGKDSVVIVLNADIATMDPNRSASLMDSQVYTNIYDQLFTVDKTGAYVPSLAESWTVSPDGKTYIFNIRKGVKFHNGDALKASDVVFSFNSLMNSPYQRDQFSEIAAVKANGDSAVEVDLKSAYAPFLGSLYDALFILSEKEVTKAGQDYGEHPVGTGPYKFVKHDTGVAVTLQRFDEYWGGKAPIKDVVFKIIGDQNTAMIALKTGEVNFVYDAPAISKDDISKNAKLSVYTSPTIRLAYLLMNTKAKPFDNVLVRQAMNYAVDKGKVITVATEGMANPTDGIFSKDIFGYSMINGYAYDPQKAKDLLAKAGYPNGLKVSFKTMSGEFDKVAQSVQEDLGKVGVTASIDVGEKNAYIQALQKGNYQMGAISCSVGSDADYYSILFGTGSQANFSQYGNPKIDALFQSGKETVDKDKRLVIYHNLAQAINDEAVVVPLYYPVNLSAGSADLNVGYIDPQAITAVNAMSWKK